MNFIAECTLLSRKLHDGEEKREYIALSEVKRLFDAYLAEKVAEMEKKKLGFAKGDLIDRNETGETGTVVDMIACGITKITNDTISACQKILKEG